MELNRKAKGDLAELKVATDLRARGYEIVFPYGEDWDFDLIRCRESSAIIDWLAVWDATMDRCYYLPAAELGTGMTEVRLRLALTANSQIRRVRMASDYADI